MVLTPTGKSPANLTKMTAEACNQLTSTFLKFKRQGPILMKTMPYLNLSFSSSKKATDTVTINSKLLLDLPNEILLQIADHLSEEYRILFSLSCKFVQTLLDEV
jgi:hypothetical protein